MKKTSLKITYEEEKLKAIKVAFSEKNKEFDTEIIKFLDNLYEKNVPKLLKRYIENNDSVEKDTNPKTDSI